MVTTSAAGPVTGRPFACICCANAVCRRFRNMRRSRPCSARSCMGAGAGMGMEAGAAAAWGGGGGKRVRAKAGAYST